MPEAFEGLAVIDVDRDGRRRFDVDRDGRRRFDAASKAALVAACLEPGASVARLALEHGVNANLLWKWLRQRRDAPSSPGGSREPVPPFVQVGMEGRPEVVSPVASRSLNGRQMSPARVEACLLNGVKLALSYGDMEALRMIIGVLGHVQTGR